jgi:hypothetical protein
MDFFIGRDVVTEESARIIGSNYCEEPKDQAQLDEEGAAIRRFIERYSFMRKDIFDKSSHYYSAPAKVQIAYLISPFCSLDSFRKLLDEIDVFKALKNEHVQIDFNLNLVSPYPGTRFRAEHIDCVREPENFSLFPDGFSMWDESKLSPSGRRIVGFFKKHAQNNND